MARAVSTVLGKQMTGRLGQVLTYRRVCTQQLDKQDDEGVPLPRPHGVSPTS